MDYPLLNLFWSFLWFFCLVLWFMLLFRVFGDLFRRNDIGGWGKTGWTIFVIFLPFIGVFTYLITQGREMAERDVRRAEIMRQQTDEYIRSVATGNGQAGNGHAGTGHSSVEEIAQAKQLLDSGTITADEFSQLKQRALPECPPATGGRAPTARPPATCGWTRQVEAPPLPRSG